jgi:hypothetical protein
LSDAPVKRSHQLALDNVRRIAETLREERNNLTILVQEQREVLNDAVELLESLRSLGSAEQQLAIDRLVERMNYF